MSEPNSHDLRVNGVLSRLEAVIDAENAAIGSDRRFDFKQSNALKSRCLYDMTVLFRVVKPSDLDEQQKNLLATVKAKLDRNQLKVRAHMEAVRDIAEMIKATVTASEADGTYSADQFRTHDLS
ncbi:hypothetical protein LL06_12555 [Hoeflea sp. BAL378]|uniref:hypothetical protein n=1 Tax=Hoeflea sp. BAL378 TaxID=1547437 RepID=UPI0005132E34|nr:hypothetical protein [Hoeflea sp. BAL378]KGF69153.1 hypothetical protein LL06_12555 [Hoeflea sp. BAL378]